MSNELAKRMISGLYGCPAESITNYDTLQWQHFVLFVKTIVGRHRDVHCTGLDLLK